MDPSRKLGASFMQSHEFTDILLSCYKGQSVGQALQSPVAFGKPSSFGPRTAGPA